MHSSTLSMRISEQNSNVDCALKTKNRINCASILTLLTKNKILRYIYICEVHNSVK